MSFDQYALIFCFIQLLFAAVWVSNTDDPELRTRRGDVTALLLVSVAWLCFRCWGAHQAPAPPPVPVSSGTFSGDTDKRTGGYLDTTRAVYTFNVDPSGRVVTQTQNFLGTMCGVSPELQRVGGR